MSTLSNDLTHCRPCTSFTSTGVSMFKRNKLNDELQIPKVQKKKKTLSHFSFDCIVQSA